MFEGAAREPMRCAEWTAWCLRAPGRRCRRVARGRPSESRGGTTALGAVVPRDSGTGAVLLVAVLPSTIRARLSAQRRPEHGVAVVVFDCRGRWWFVGVARGRAAGRPRGHVVPESLLSPHVVFGRGRRGWAWFRGDVACFLGGWTLTGGYVRFLGRWLPWGMLSGDRGCRHIWPVGCFRAAMRWLMVVGACTLLVSRRFGDLVGSPVACVG